MKSAEIRSAFLEYFKKNDHQVLPSSTLVPDNDPTLLFTNAGMVQFKDVFLGKIKPLTSRATTSQRCVRAGGKHNDLENVGHTARHHTFFEMLGNFSFGDYFKREAIQYAWHFLTRELHIPVDRLWVTVYKDDDEAADIWLNLIGVDKDRVVRCGDASNFWSMGDVGPCGPCTEIFYDHGPEVAGGPPGSPEEDGDRYVEIWNLVFMQYNREKDGSMKNLPAPSVDTGMGLERIAAVMQGVHSNYDIDIFQALIHFAARVLGVEDKTDDALKVIADHIRSAVFLIHDGVVPGNEGRSYVLRRIMRRAIRHGYQLGKNEPFMHLLVTTLVAEMGSAYPRLHDDQSRIEKIILKEEEQFLKTLSRGMLILQDLEEKTGGVLDGQTVFKLYDTYGFPIDLTEVIAKESGLSIDRMGFDECMAEQKIRSRVAGDFSSQAIIANDVDFGLSTLFLGYETLNCAAMVVKLLDENFAELDELSNAPAYIFLDQTPFYAEGGGQVGDQGLITFGAGVFDVDNTLKIKSAHAHHGYVKGVVRVGDAVTAQVNEGARRATMYNHSATHLLNAALRAVLGAHVLQKGSLVDSKRLRFDFSHHAQLSATEKDNIEALVNDAINSDFTVNTQLMTPEKAKAAGALSLAGEAYAQEVRVLSMGDFSKELCGGTHVSHTGEIRQFKIKSETGIASGVRRIEAVTGDEVDNFLTELAERQRQLQAASAKREQEKAEMRAQAKQASQAGVELIDKAIEVGGVFVLAETLPHADGNSLRDATDQLKAKLGSAVVVLAAVNGDKIQLIAGVTKDCIPKVKAGDLVNFVALQLGGRGGGRPDMAQAGGEDVSALPEALASVEAWVRERL